MFGLHLGTSVNPGMTVCGAGTNSQHCQRFACALWAHNQMCISRVAVIARIVVFVCGLTGIRDASSFSCGQVGLLAITSGSSFAEAGRLATLPVIARIVVSACRPKGIRAISFFSFRDYSTSPRLAFLAITFGDHARVCLRI